MRDILIWMIIIGAIISSVGYYNPDLLNNFDNKIMKITSKSQLAKH